MSVSSYFYLLDKVPSASDASFVINARVCCCLEFAFPSGPLKHCVIAQSCNVTATVVTKSVAHPTFGFPDSVSGGYKINDIEGATIILLE